MKKIIFILASIVITGTGFYGCKKGEGDPSISFKSRKSRLAGEWELEKGTNTDMSTGYLSTTTWSGTSVTNTTTLGPDTYTSIGTGSYKLTIEKDGTWSSNQNITWIGTPSVIDNTTSSGTWNWSGKVGELKNKSQVILTTLAMTETFGSDTDIYSYTGDDAPSVIWNIYQLKSKEMIIQWEGTTLETSSGTSSSSKGEYTWEQGQ